MVIYANVSGVSQAEAQGTQEAWASKRHDYHCQAQFLWSWCPVFSPCILNLKTFCQLPTQGEKKKPKNKTKLVDAERFGGCQRGGWANGVYLNVAKILKILTIKKLCARVMVHVNQTHGDDHFTIYTNTELLCFIPETYYMSGTSQYLKISILSRELEPYCFRFTILPVVMSIPSF